MFDNNQNKTVRHLNDPQFNNRTHFNSGYTEVTEEVEMDMRDQFGDGKSKFQNYTTNQL